MPTTIIPYTFKQSLLDIKDLSYSNLPQKLPDGLWEFLKNYSPHWVYNIPEVIGTFGVKDWNGTYNGRTYGNTEYAYLFFDDDKCVEVVGSSTSITIAEIISARDDYGGTLLFWYHTHSTDMLEYPVYTDNDINVKNILVEKKLHKSTITENSDFYFFPNQKGVHWYSIYKNKPKNNNVSEIWCYVNDLGVPSNTDLTVAESFSGGLSNWATTGAKLFTIAINQNITGIYNLNDGNKIGYSFRTNKHTGTLNLPATYTESSIYNRVDGGDNNMYHLDKLYQDFVGYEISNENGINRLYNYYGINIDIPKPGAGGASGGDQELVIGDIADNTGGFVYDKVPEPSAEFIIGNPKLSGFSEEITLSKEDEPITTKWSSFDSKMEFDLIGNMFMEFANNFYTVAKKHLITLESKEEKIKGEYNLENLKLFVRSLEEVYITSKNVLIAGSENLSINGANVNINSNNVLIGNELLYDDEVEKTDPNPYDVSKDENKIDNIRKFPDEVMTVNRFRYWFATAMQPYLLQILNLTAKYNTHTHGTSPTPLANEIITTPESKYKGAIATGNLIGSKIIKTY